MRTSRKRTIAIIVPVTVLALAGIATAAALTTTSATLGGGGTTVTNNCALNVSYDLGVLSTDIKYVAASTGPTVKGGYYLTKVVVAPVAPISADCKNAAFRVTVTDSNGLSLGEGVGALDLNGVPTVAKTPLSGSGAFAQDVARAYATVSTATQTTAVVAP